MAKGFYLKISLKQKHFAHVQTDKNQPLALFILSF